MTTQPTRAPAYAHNRGFRFWLVPDLAMAVSLATLIALFCIMPGTGGLFNDADTGWHIRSGERVVSVQLLPRGGRTAGGNSIEAGRRGF